jgi:hypothetical protein
MSDQITCPKCGSTQISAEKKGYSGGKAAAGVILTGGIGLLAGTIGSKDVIITCLSCGNQWKAGEQPKPKPRPISSGDMKAFRIMGIIALIPTLLGFIVCAIFLFTDFSMKAILGCLFFGILSGFFWLLSRKPKDTIAE